MIIKNVSLGSVVLCAMMAYISLSKRSEAAVVLQIDVSDPSAVVIKATPGLSLTTSNLRRALDGITIENFFTSAVNYPASSNSSGDLIDTLGIVNQGGFSGFGTFEYSNNDGAFGSANDLSVFRNGGDGTPDQIFTTGTRAFTGSETFDFSSTASAIPASGTTGDVITGYFNSGTPDHGEVIGQWVVVIPEPSSALLGALGLLLVAKRRRSVRS